MWTKPEGNSSFYRVQWTDGTVTGSQNVTETYKTITNLTAGVQYEITVTAVTHDGSTDGESTSVSQYTRPDEIGLVNFSTTTTSISLNWTSPPGEAFMYSVEWSYSGLPATSSNTRNTFFVLPNLSPATIYNIKITAIAGDNETTGQGHTFSAITKPAAVLNIHTVNVSLTSLSLEWTSPGGNVTSYSIEWMAGEGGEPFRNTTSETSFTINNLIPGSQYNITVAAVAVYPSNIGEGISITTFTKPGVVRNLNVTNVTTSSISVKWTKPEGSSSFYRVQWTDGNVTGSENVTETHKTITNLTAGVQYQITVTAVTADGSTAGASSSVSQYTSPVRPEDITVTARGTDYLNISWTLPEGRVNHYVVNISDERQIQLNSRVTMFPAAHFTALNPGRIFFITVTAVAGEFSQTSDRFTFATVPTPPGSIIIGQRTNSTLSLSWAFPHLMENAPNISYNVTYQPVVGDIHNANTLENNIELPSLSSGTSYSISVYTVGPQNLKSTDVQNSAFTLPNPVLNLAASPESNTSVTVTWSDPLGAQPYYTYRVQAFSPTGPPFDRPFSNTKSIEVTNLDPGTRYDINVTVIAAPGSDSEAEKTSSYTRPNAVTGLTVEDLNTTAIRLTWVRPPEYKPSYSYLVMVVQETMVVRNVSTETETYTFIGLTPGQQYTFTVFTVLEGVKSRVENITGFTKPDTVTDITAIGSTTTMSVSWEKAVGHVVSYTVELYRDSNLVADKTVSNTTFNTEFQLLIPGVLYCVRVLTKSGPLESSNASVCNATLPNPPGPIMVVSQTVDSINFTWSNPENMDHNQYNFSVRYNLSSFQTGNNWFPLKNLQSGSPFTISVVTVGVLKYESTAVTTQNYTRPYAVTALTQTEITTNSVTLQWTQRESKPDYSYVVETTNGSFSRNEVVFTKHKKITELLSGSNYSFTVTTQTADGTEAAPVTVSYFTRPYSIENLEGETINTTAVRLVWTKPLEYKSEYTYRIETSGCDSQNQTVAGENADISELNPGTNCTFCVFVRAADGIEGEARCTSQYTKPEAVQPSISSQGSNNSVLVSWTAPPGRVEQYKVHLNGTATGSKEHTLGPEATSFLFGNLSAGRLYIAVVTTCSGPFNASSGLVSNATFPNPPGPIDVLTKTTSSIDITWGEAPLMTDASFHYQLSTSPSTPGGADINTNLTSHTFASLPSGTSYDIFVVTVGVNDFKSQTVQNLTVTTRPFSVKSLKIFPKEKSINVTWDLPDEYKESYRYNVTWQSAGGPIIDGLISQNKFNIDKLVPGVQYKISVTTETSDGTQGASRQISDCTNASPVQNLTCVGPNKPNAQVILEWHEPTGQYNGFQVTGKGNEINTTSGCCNHTVSNLRHYTQYEIVVETQSCGHPSTAELVSCTTGITNPPIPGNYESLVTVVSTVYNHFTIQINSTLLNNINGPIKFVGVLVANTVPGDTSDLAKYVGQTYNNWKSQETPVYLATVRQINVQSRSGGSNLIIVVGDDSTWAQYYNGPLDATGTYHYAIVLFTSLALENNLVNEEKSFLSITQIYTSSVTLPQDPTVIGLAVGVPLGIFCILLIILIGFIVYWKRFSNKEPQDIQIQSMRAKVSVAVRVEDYEAYYKKQKADSNCGFAEEFEDLKLVGTAQSKTNALTLENKPKNRYNNVLPYDSSRVKLSIIHGSPYDDYINANYMPGHNSRKEFIAAQGPLPATVADFWRMIWEKNVQTLVMLTRCNEQGRVKCEKYWDYGTKHFGNITVTTSSEIPLEDWTIRDFNIKNVKTAETRSVRHFHFTAWPDHGVPQTTELLISFRHLVREHMDQYSRHSPTVVHCSAGVGRTGTFIAIDRLIFQIERENFVDVYGIVNDLRMHRPLMVQTEDQYVFLNQCAMDIIRSRTGTNVDLIYQNTAALCIYENIEPKKCYPKNGYRNA